MDLIADYMNDAQGDFANFRNKVAVLSEKTVAEPVPMKREGLARISPSKRTKLKADSLRRRISPRRKQ